MWTQNTVLLWMSFTSAKLEVCTFEPDWRSESWTGMVHCSLLMPPMALWQDVWEKMIPDPAIFTSHRRHSLFNFDQFNDGEPANIHHRSTHTQAGSTEVSCSPHSLIAQVALIFSRSNDRPTAATAALFSQVKLLMQFSKLVWWRHSALCCILRKLTQLSWIYMKWIGQSEQLISTYLTHYQSRKVLPAMLLHDWENPIQSCKCRWNIVIWWGVFSWTGIFQQRTRALRLPGWKWTPTSGEIEVRGADEWRDNKKVELGPARRHAPNTPLWL